MCGIFGYLGNNSHAGNLILEGLKSLEYRGYDSWGIALKVNSSTPLPSNHGSIGRTRNKKSKSENKLFLEKHVGKIGNAKLPVIKSNAGIGHTRWATHGGVLEKNAHPHTDCTKNIVVVHNGIVENFEELKKKLLSKNHKFLSDTDSEVIAHLVEEELKTQNDLKKAVLSVFNKISGMNAIIVYAPYKDQFVAIKNGSPMVFWGNDNEYFLASDSSALSPYTRKVYFLEDNELLYMDRNSYQLYEKGLKKKRIEFFDLNFKKEQAELGKYKHYMIKEISEQIQILTQITLEQKQNILNASALIKKAYGTYLIGCGTAFYAALSATYLFSKIARRHINCTVGSEFSYLVDFLKDTSLVIAFSQSGETIDIISSIKKAKEKKTKILAITNVLGSTLYRMADYRLLLNAGPEKCVLATKSFTSKIAFIYLIAHALSGNYDQGVLEIKKAVKQIGHLLDQKNKIKELAEKLKNKDHIYILGRGVSYPTALESALKIKEVSYIHAEGFAAGELKHGVIALIEKGTPVIIYNPEDETFEDTLSSAYEVKARGAYTIGVSSKNNKIFDEFIEVENCNDATIIPNVVVAQLLGYYLALSKGFDPDKPRNLAKSVTVK